MPMNDCTEGHDSIEGHKVIVMAIEHYNTLSMIRSLGKRGIRPVYIAIQGKREIASSSRYISRCHYAYSVDDAYRILLKYYGSEKVSPFVLCADDRTIGYIDSRYEEVRDRFICFNAGQNGRINEYMDKYRIIELAKKYGLNTLDTVCVERGVIPEGIEYPVITKSISPLSGGWKADVFICGSREELERAYWSIQSPAVILQKYIDKKNEYCLEGFSIHGGRDVHFSISVTYNYLLKDYYSPYLTVGKADHERINKALAGMFKEIRFEGLFEVEFLIGQDGTLYFDEINFRNSPWSYPSAALGRCLPEMWMRAVLDEGFRYGPVEVPEHFTAMIEPVDYAKRVEGGMATYAVWLFDFKTANVTFYFDPDDPRPFFLMMEDRGFYS